MSLRSRTGLCSPTALAGFAHLLPALFPLRSLQEDGQEVLSSLVTLVDTRLAKALPRSSSNEGSGFLSGCLHSLLLHLEGGPGVLSPKELKVFTYFKNLKIQLASHFCVRQCPHRPRGMGQRAARGQGAQQPAVHPSWGWRIGSKREQSLQ